MLVEKMTPEEINIEIFTDWNAVKGSLDRLTKEYDRERAKRKISKTETYHKTYAIKSHKKNLWNFLLSKAPSENTYKGVDSINICSIVNYYTPLGLRVFKIMPSGGLSVYNAHLFTRYNDRMSLGLIKPLDIVLHFFKNNGYYTAKIISREERELSIATCKDGLLLGELLRANNWILHKTFIDKGLKSKAQDKIEEGLLNSLQEAIVQELNKADFNKDLYNYQADIKTALNNPTTINITLQK
jgi:hypothetical protein